MTPVERGYDTQWNLATDVLPESTYFRNGYVKQRLHCYHVSGNVGNQAKKRKEVLLLTLILKTTLISNSLDKTNEMLPEKCFFKKKIRYS